MNTQTLQAVLDDRSPALSIRDAWTNCSRQNCCARIQKVEKQLAKFPRDSSLLNPTNRGSITPNVFLSRKNMAAVSTSCESPSS